MGQPLAAGRLSAILRRYPEAKRYWIGFSGGLDSTVLAHLCVSLRGTDAPWTFAAAHIHHGLHPSADAWAQRVQDFCRAANLPLEIRHVDARAAAGESPEAAARRARYGELQTLLGTGEVLLTAQHRDDQAETVLLQLLRGAGLSGLAAMPEWTAFGRGFLARPLLDYPRRELHDYAVRQGLTWAEDPGNLDLRFDRNYLRHEILPRMQRRWPGLYTALCRSARHCAEANLLLAESSRELLSTVRHPAGNTLRVASLSALSLSRQRLVVREWLQCSGYRMPSAAIIERILREVLPARGDRRPEVAWNEGAIRRYRNELYLLPPMPAFDSSVEMSWPGDAPLILAGGNGTLTATLEPGAGVDPLVWRSNPISVRYRRGGEVLKLPGRAGTRELKKLLQEAAVPTWTRARIPLIYLGNALAAVADRWISEEFTGDPGGTNVRIRWDRSAGVDDSLASDRRRFPAS